VPLPLPDPNGAAVDGAAVDRAAQRWQEPDSRLGPQGPFPGLPGLPWFSGWLQMGKHPAPGQRRNG